MMTNTALTLGEAITRCNQELGLSKHTERSYRNALRRFVEYIGVPLETSLSQLSIDEFIRFPFWLLKQELAKQTMLAYKSGVANFLEWLVLNRYIEITMQEKSAFTDACKKLARKHEEHLPEILSDEDMAKVIAAARQRVEQGKHGIYAPIPLRDLAIVLILNSSGLRVGEITSLLVGDIDLDEHKIQVRGKGDKDEYVLFDEEAKEALLAYWNTRGYTGDDDPAFARHDRRAGGKHLFMAPNGVRWMTAELSELSGVKIHPHAFRHHFAVKVLRKSQNLAMTQDLMRHSSPAVTRKYAVISNAERDQAYEKIFNGEKS